MSSGDHPRLTTTRSTDASTNGKKKVFLANKLPAKALEKLSQANVHVEHYWDSDEPIPREAFLNCAKDVEGIVCIGSGKVDKELLASTPNLTTVATVSVGYDHIDVDACKEHRVSVGNTPGVLTETTADLVVALLLATARRIPEAVEAVRSNDWARNKRLLGKDVHSSTVGIVGMGRIGQAVARRLRGFGCTIIYTGPRPKPELAGPVQATFVDMDTLLATSDFVVPMCPLSAATRGLFNAEKFQKMKQDSVFINATRGQLVDQQALVDALRNGPLYAAGLDVTDPEPIFDDHPLMAEDLKNKLTILPHIGSASVTTRENMALIAVENVVRGVNGEKLLHAVYEP